MKNANLKFLKYVKFLFKKKKATIRDNTNNSVTAMPIAYEGKIKKAKYKNIFEEIKFFIFPNVLYTKLMMILSWNFIDFWIF